MKKYAKLINETAIEFAPKNKGSIINYNLNIEAMMVDGYKPFIPAEKEIGKAYNITYKETADAIEEIAEEIPQPTPEELLEQAKKEKSKEASLKAFEYIQSGKALFEFELDKHIEATDGNIAKMTAYALAYIAGQLAPDDTVVWNTDESETVELTQADVSQILNGLGAIQADIWTIRYPEYLSQIALAETIDEVNAIIIEYDK